MSHNYHRTGQSRLNAIDVAALANEHERRGKPITVQQIARYFAVPRHVAQYAVTWLVKHGYATTRDGAVYLVRIDDGERPYAIMMDEHGHPHRLYCLSTSDRRFLERTGWVLVSAPTGASA